MMQEIIGTKIFVFFFKIATDERLHFSKENAMNCFIIAAAYTASRRIVNGTGILISTYGAVLNPAIAFGITFASVFPYPGTTLKWIWIFCGLPFAGSIIAIIFYRFIYLKTQLMIMKDEVREEEAIGETDVKINSGILDD
jgi:glycerol uptake facilitator-like aquaporin